MDSNRSTRAPRQGVLVLSHPDGHLEVFAEKCTAVHIARVPTAGSSEAERQSEDVTHWLLPRRYRDLHRADRLRATGTTRPLKPSALKASLEVPAVIEDLNRLAAMFAPQPEAMVWT